MRRTAVGLGVAVLACAASPDAAKAQEAWIANRTAVEAVAAISTTSAEFTDPMLVFDAVATVRVGGGFDVIVRPYSRRRPGGDWSAEFYQLQVQYQSSTRVPVRIDAGVITSPLGLGTLEMRPDHNPVIGAPFYYYAPLPRFDASPGRMNLIAPGYPLGAIVSASGTKWDVRGGVTDGTPARMRHSLPGDEVRAAATVVAGGGVTPVPGLRLGAGVAHGRYRSSSSSSGMTTPPAGDHATVFNAEGEYSVGFTRVMGEWIVDRFQTATGPAISRGYTLLAVRTLSPRVFVAGRASRVSTPVQTPAGRVGRSAVGADATVGCRITPELTLRGGYQGFRGYGLPAWDHAAATSIVWSKRWW